jgi:hypothetical protein
VIPFRSGKPGSLSTLTIVKPPPPALLTRISREETLETQAVIEASETTSRVMISMPWARRPLILEGLREVA